MGEKLIKSQSCNKTKELLIFLLFKKTKPNLIASLASKILIKNPERNKIVDRRLSKNEKKCISPRPKALPIRGTLARNLNHFGQL
jgi:hypothetical protein